MLDEVITFVQEAKIEIRQMHRPMSGVGIVKTPQEDHVGVTR